MEVYPHLLMKYTFLGWWRVTKEELTDQWEKLARARLFRQRSEKAHCRTILRERSLSKGQRRVLKVSLYLGSAGYTVMFPNFEPVGHPLAVMDTILFC